MIILINNIKLVFLIILISFPYFVQSQENNNDTIGKQNIEAKKKEVLQEMKEYEIKHKDIKTNKSNTIEDILSNFIDSGAVDSFGKKMGIWYEYQIDEVEEKKIVKIRIINGEMIKDKKAIIRKTVEYKDSTMITINKEYLERKNDTIWIQMVQYKKTNL